MWNISSSRHIILNTPICYCGDISMSWNVTLNETNCWTEWTILTVSLLSFWALIVSVVLLSMQGQKALKFHQKYLNLCSKDEWRSYEFGTTWGWVINARIFIFGRTFHLSTTILGRRGIICMTNNNCNALATTSNYRKIRATNTA